MSLLAPSILSADFTNLENQIKEVEKGGADLIHCDIMDGIFVPNITFGPIVVSAVNRARYNLYVRIIKTVKIIITRFSC